MKESARTRDAISLAAGALGQAKKSNQCESRLFDSCAPALEESARGLRSHREDRLRQREDEGGFSYFLRLRTEFETEIKSWVGFRECRRQVQVLSNAAEA